VEATGVQTRPRQAPTVAVFVGDLQERPSSQLRNSHNLQGQAFAKFDNDVRSERTRGGMRLAFAERVLPRAADLWVQASLEQRQRFQ
jgi:hypothetical protein